jgi:hypothetical protein
VDVDWGRNGGSRKLKCGCMGFEDILAMVVDERIDDSWVVIDGRTRTWRA